MKLERILDFLRFLRFGLLAASVALTAVSAAVAVPLPFAVDVQIVDSSIVQLPSGSYLDAGTFSVESDDIALTGISDVIPLSFFVGLAGENWDETFDAGETIRFTDGTDPRVDYDGVNTNGSRLDLVRSSPGGVTLEVTIGGAIARGNYDVRLIPEPSTVLLAGLGLVALGRRRFNPCVPNLGLKRSSLILVERGLEIREDACEHRPDPQPLDG